MLSITSIVLQHSKRQIVALTKLFVKRKAAIPESFLGVLPKLPQMEIGYIMWSGAIMAPDMATHDKGFIAQMINFGNW